MSDANFNGLEPVSTPMPVATERRLHGVFSALL